MTPRSGPLYKASSHLPHLKPRCLCLPRLTLAQATPGRKLQCPTVSWSLGLGLNRHFASLPDTRLPNRSAPLPWELRIHILCAWCLHVSLHQYPRLLKPSIGNSTFQTAHNLLLHRPCPPGLPALSPRQGRLSV
jgi:hypothetical protein